MEVLIMLAVLGAVGFVFVYFEFYRPKPDLDLSDSFLPLEPLNPLIEKTNMEEQSDNGVYLYLKSKSLLGIDLTPTDRIPDDVACVAQLQEVFRRTFGRYVGVGAALYSTKALKDHLLKDDEFTPVEWDKATAGDICVFATGEGNLGARGHCFVVGKVDWMSNNSKTGLWSADYTKQSAHDYYVKKLGFKPYIFRLR